MVRGGVLRRLSPFGFGFILIKLAKAISINFKKLIFNN
jgi:hypothetical protein